MPKEAKDSGAKTTRKGRASPKSIDTKRKKKDPDAPKRPSAAFFVFSAEKREEVKQNNPGATIGSIAKVMGDLWKKLTDEQKKPYNEIAAQDKLRYNEEKKNYQARCAAQQTVVEEDEEEEDDD